jgi:hypothetical protein
MKRLGVMLTGLVALAACESGRLEDRLVACPTVSLPADVADLTRHRPGTPPDLSTIILDARVAAIPATCRPGPRGQSVIATVALRATVERGPAATGREAALPWFIAVLDGDTEEVLSRQAFLLPVVFPPNVARLTVTSPAVEVSFPTTGRRRVQDHRILVGFLLDAEEVALNRRRGPR